jgi:hypothetical protein
MVAGHFNSLLLPLIPHDHKKDIRIKQAFNGFIIFGQSSAELQSPSDYKHVTHDMLV